jgi:hypothetical protein
VMAASDQPVATQSATSWPHGSLAGGGVVGRSQFPHAARASHASTSIRRSMPEAPTKRR